MRNRKNMNEDVLMRIPPEVIPISIIFVTLFATFYGSNYSKFMKI